MELFDLIVEVSKPASDLAYQLFGNSDGKIVVSEVIKTVAALIGLVGVFFGAYKTWKYSIKHLEEIIDKYIEKRTKSAISQRRAILGKLKVARDATNPLEKIDVEACLEQALKLFNEKKVRQAEASLLELNDYLVSKKAVAQRHIDLTRAELITVNLLIGELAKSRSDSKRALDALHDAMQLDDRDPDVLMAKGDLHLANGDHNGALAMYQNLKARAEEDSDDLLICRSIQKLAFATCPANQRDAWNLIKSATEHSDQIGDPQQQAEAYFSRAKLAKQIGYGREITDALQIALSKARIAQLDGLAKEIEEFA